MIPKHLPSVCCLSNKIKTSPLSRRLLSFSLFYKTSKTTRPNWHRVPDTQCQNNTPPRLAVVRLLSHRGRGASPSRSLLCSSTATPRLKLVNLSHFHIDTTHCVTIRPEIHYFVVLARILLYDLWVEMLHSKDNLKHIIHHLRRIEMRPNQCWTKRLRPCKDLTTAF